MPLTNTAACLITGVLETVNQGWSPFWDGWVRPNLMGLDQPEIPSNVPGSSQNNPYVKRWPKNIAKRWAKNKIDCGVLDNNPPQFPFNTPGGNPNRNDGGPCTDSADGTWIVTVYNPSEISQIKYDSSTNEIVITDRYNFQKSPNQDGWHAGLEQALRNAGLNNTANAWGSLADGLILGSPILPLLDQAGAQRKAAAGITPSSEPLGNIDGLKPTYHEYRIHICSFKSSNPTCYAAYVANGTFPNICCRDDDFDKNFCGGGPFENENPC
jgi:hypothetical protein